MKKSTFEIEAKYFQNGYEFVIGIDEAGRGPLAGPVVACATTARNLHFLISNLAYRQAGFQNSNSQTSNSQKAPKDSRIHLIRDSKTLSPLQRNRAFDFVMENFHVGVGICDHKTIDRINILEASLLAMRMALSDLRKKIDFHGGKSILLIDGKQKLSNLTLEQEAIINGDALSKSISAASIVAKVTRDRIMKEMHKIYPDYAFDKHKGYGTKLHLDSLKKHGPCEIHRKTFAPVSSL